MAEEKWVPGTRRIPPAERYGTLGHEVRHLLDGRKWPAADRGLTEQEAWLVSEFANWLEQSKQPGPVLLAQELLDRQRKNPSASIFDRTGPVKAPVEPDVVRDVDVTDATCEVKTMATSEEFMAALNRGDCLIYACRGLGGTWDYIVETIK